MAVLPVKIRLASRKDPAIEEIAEDLFEDFLTRNRVMPHVLLYYSGDSLVAKFVQEQPRARDFAKKYSDEEWFSDSDGEIDTIAHNRFNAFVNITNYSLDHVINAQIGKITENKEKDPANYAVYDSKIKVLASKLTEYHAATEVIGLYLYSNKRTKLNPNVDKKEYGSIADLKEPLQVLVNYQMNNDDDYDTKLGMGVLDLISNLNDSVDFDLADILECTVHYIAAVDKLYNSENVIRFMEEKTPRRVLHLGSYVMDTYDHAKMAHYQANMDERTENGEIEVDAYTVLENGVGKKK